MKNQRGFLTLAALLSLGTAGCATGTELQGAEQENIGLGIVLGTLGAQQMQGWSRVPPADARIVRGQVLAIEGGAYVIREVSGEERRLSHDENTRIDRPAHVGDKIEACVDQGGRATEIRNIDHEERD